MSKPRRHTLAAIFARAVLIMGLALEMKRVIFAFLPVKGQFAIGDID